MDGICALIKGAPEITLVPLNTQATMNQEAEPHQALNCLQENSLLSCKK
jgi:hypothetical protein